jgi:hypothetical protein
MCLKAFVLSANFLSLSSFFRSLESSWTRPFCVQQAKHFVSLETAFRQWTCTSSAPGKILWTIQLKSYRDHWDQDSFKYSWVPRASKSARQRDQKESVEEFRWWIIKLINLTCRLVLNYLWVYVMLFPLHFLRARRDCRSRQSYTSREKEGETRLLWNSNSKVKNSYASVNIRQRSFKEQEGILRRSFSENPLPKALKPPQLWFRRLLEHWSFKKFWKRVKVMPLHDVLW